MINHFRNHYELTRKDLLIKNLKRMQRSLIRDERTAEVIIFLFTGRCNLPRKWGRDGGGGWGLSKIIIILEKRKKRMQRSLIREERTAEVGAVFLYNSSSNESVRA
ncbi:hypothetical protein T492DRAFT_81939 [Pavlovales sp. CCMP2436]|nr:hypothetical protein T492DRAFT_81939 [Pavlovales sp. CCMP2436]